jgi:Peptidase family M48
MSLLLLGVGLLLLGLPGALQPLGARVAPSEWCRAVVACLRIGRFSVRVALGLAALPPLLAAVGAHEVAHACHRSATAGLSVPLGIGWVAGVALGASVVRSVRTGRRNATARRCLRVEPWLGRHRLDDGVEIVTVPSADRLAYAVPGRPDQVIVSDGLLGALDSDEAEAVLRHERAHLRHGHHDALVLARDLESWLGWFPPTRESVGALRLGVERWADEDAGSGSEAARPAVRRALVKVVTLAVESTPAFTDARTIAARLDALAITPPSPGLPVRVAATGPMIGLCALVIGAVVTCALAAHRGLDGLLGHCPF